MTTIVVGIDFSESSKTAAAQAGRLAALRGATLHALHVIDELVLDDMRQVMKLPAEQLREETLRNAQDHLARFLIEAGLDIERVVPSAVVGHPFQELLRRVQTTGAELLVLGAHGSSPPGRRAGSLATRCVRKAATRVLLVRRAHVGRYKRIVALVDFSETSGLALKEALATARQDGAALEVLHVFDPPWARLHYRSPSPESSPDFRQQYQETLQGRLKQFVEQWAGEAPEPAASLHLMESVHVGAGIIGRLAEISADLVVLGTRGASRLRVVLLGTIAERIVQESPCSVLAIKPADYAFEIDG